MNELQHDGVRTHHRLPAVPAIPVYIPVFELIPDTGRFDFASRSLVAAVDRPWRYAVFLRKYGGRDHFVIQEHIDYGD